MAKIETIYSDPVDPIIANLFGTGVKRDKDLGYQQTGQIGDKWWQPKGDFADPLFTKEAMGEISEYLKTPLEIGDIGEWGRENITADSLASMYSNFQETGGNLMDSLNEGLNTGWAVDIDPIVRQAMANYYGDIVPQTVENFAGTTGISSSGFGRAMETGARRLATDIGAFDYAAQEAAAGRRAGVTPMAGDIMGQYLAGPLQYGADIASYDQMLANIERESMPGAPLMNAFSGLSGMGEGTVVVEPEEASDTAAGLNAFASFAP